MPTEKEKPVLFTTDLATLAYRGAKTETRRPVRYKSTENGMQYVPSDAEFSGVHVGLFTFETQNDIYSVKPIYNLGDTLYVREAVRIPVLHTGSRCVDIEYADGTRRDNVQIMDEERFLKFMRRRAKTPSRILSYPSIHMSQELSRTKLTVTGVSVERVRNILDSDAKAEGYPSKNKFLKGFFELYPEMTPGHWVWVVTFERKE